MELTTTTPNTLITTYVEMNHRSQFNPSFIHASHIRIEEMHTVDLAFYRFMYGSVGEKLRWRDRLIMPNAELHAQLSKSSTHIFTLYVSGVPAGYIELANEKGNCEVAYFGLREEFWGRGYGKHLLSFGIQKAWDLGAHRIWLHTCNLDSPHALSNYLKRGFSISNEVHEPMPDIYQ